MGHELHRPARLLGKCWAGLAGGAGLHWSHRAGKPVHRTRSCRATGLQADGKTCDTFAGPVVGVEDVAKPAGAVVAANVVVAVVVAGQLLVTPLQTLVYVCQEQEEVVSPRSELLCPGRWLGTHRSGMHNFTVRLLQHALKELPLKVALSSGVGWL